MVDFLLINGTDTNALNVNVGNVDVPKRTMRVCTMTAAELLAYLQVAGQAAMPTGATQKQRREAARILKYRKSATGANVL
jgi:hypothetical protein